MTSFDKVKVPAPDGEEPASFNPDCFREALLHRAEETAPILEELAAELERLGYSAWDILGVKLAVEEAIDNGLRHGNRGDPTKHVRIRCYVRPELMLAEVEDEGLGFDPALVADPALAEDPERARGRGLLLMRHFMNWMHFSPRGNLVRLCKCPSKCLR
jgi:anti-sigma regulatory factor (Ser/Thr protein kinase)